MGNRDAIDRLTGLMELLRSERGCPWDREQTLKSLIPYILEEAQELCHAIEEGSPEALKEECGDLLFQVVFVAQIARERGWFSLEDAMEACYQKMVRRHPHVFGTERAESSQQVLSRWAEIKRREKGSQHSGYLSDIGRGFSALMRANRVSRRVAKVGFDWQSPEQLMDKVEEELAELKEALASGNRDHLEEELGDMLFTIVNMCRLAGVDPEWALYKTTDKFIERFHHIEQTLKAQGKSLEGASLDEMETLWQEAKRKDKSQG